MGHWAGGLGLLVAAIVAPLASTLIQTAISRLRKYLADETGAGICGTPKGLAGALQKLQAAGPRIPLDGATPQTAYLFIVNPLSGQSPMSLFSTHPPLEKRVARLLSLAPAYIDSGTIEFVSRG